MGKYAVESFNRDHRTMRAPNVSVIGKLTLGEYTLYKYDVRLTKPNADYIDPPAMHALEHIIALEIRNHLAGVWDLSPMGCMTGFYLSVLNEGSPEKIKEIFTLCLQKVLEADEVPAANEIECGNYRFIDLAEAKRRAAALLSSF